MRLRINLARALCVAILTFTTSTRPAFATEGTSPRLQQKSAAAVTAGFSPRYVFSPPVPRAVTATKLGPSKGTSAAVINPYAVNDALRWINARLWNDTSLVNTVDRWNRAAQFSEAAGGLSHSGNTGTALSRHGSVPVASLSFTATGNINGMPCGGALPSCCTLRMESGGNPTAQNPNSSASGLWQFMHDTWNGYGGYSEAKYAPVDVQNARAAEVFAGGAGASNWYGDGCYNGR